MNKGKLDKTYTGLVEFRGQMWYVKAGRLDKTYSGTVIYNGQQYIVSSGIAKVQ